MTSLTKQQIVKNLKDIDLLIIPKSNDQTALQHCSVSKYQWNEDLGKWLFNFFVQILPNFCTLYLDSTENGVPKYVWNKICYNYANFSYKFFSQEFSAFCPKSCSSEKYKGVKQKMWVTRFNIYLFCNQYTNGYSHTSNRSINTLAHVSITRWSSSDENIKLNELTHFFMRGRPRFLLKWSVFHIKFIGNLFKCLNN